MKRHIILLIFVLTATLTYGQKKRKLFGVKTNFEKGSIVTCIGGGVVSPYYTSGSSMVIPPIITSIEFGIANRIGIGIIVGYTSSKAIGTYSVNKRYEKDYQYIIPQLRGIIHFFHNQYFDVYGGLAVGYSFGSNSWRPINNSVFPKDFDPFFQEKISGLTPGIFVGGKYYFSNLIGVYFEAGYSIAYVSTGLVIRIK